MVLELLTSIHSFDYTTYHDCAYYNTFCEVGSIKQEVESEVGSKILVYLAQRTQRAQSRLGTVAVD
jgi:hypothetical protein